MTSSMTQSTLATPEPKSNPSPDNNSPDPIRAAVLQRVSSDAQTSGAGLDAQSAVNQKRLDELEPGYEIVLDKTEEGVSGTNFPRPALMEILEEARSGAIDVLVVHDISRIGRVAPLVASYIWALNTQYGIDILTRDDRLNVHDETDLIQVMWQTTMAETDNRYRTSAVQDAHITQFSRGHLHVANLNVMFGFQKSNNEDTDEDSTESDESEKTQNGTSDKCSGDDESSERIKEGDDLEIDKDEAEVTRTLFRTVRDIGPKRDIFARTREQVSQGFPGQEIPDSDELSSMLRNSIYKGVAEWEIDSEYDEGIKRAEYRNDDWQIVDDDLFEQVQEVLDKRNQKYGYGSSSSEDESDKTHLSLQEIVRIVGWERVAAFDDIVSIQCPECGEEMRPGLVSH